MDKGGKQVAPRKATPGPAGISSENFAELLEGVRQTKRIRRGELPEARSYTADELRAPAAADRAEIRLRGACI